MASNNINGKGTLPPPEKTVCKCLNSAKDNMNEADSKAASAGTTQQSKETIKGYKICCLDRAQETHEVYQDIMSCIAIGNYKKTEIAQKNIGEYVKKDEEIEKLINESSKLLADLCTALEDADKEACALTTCIKNKVMSKSSKTSEEERAPIEALLSEINVKSKDLVAKGQNANQSIVAIAGIQTFTNTESLEAFITKLVEAVKKFKDFMDTNIKSTAEEVSNARKELNTVIEELAQVSCDKGSFITAAQGWDSFIEFICNGKCKDECLDLCTEFEKCCSSSDDYVVKSQSIKSLDQN